jgi:hypothetical protein
MKAKRRKTVRKDEPLAMKEAVAEYTTAPTAMVRTQIYLSQAQYDFLHAEGKRRNRPMAAVLRDFIDEKMRVPDEVWKNNPLLQPPAEDPDYRPRGDGVVNHDHYIYGGEKKHRKVKGRWALQPPRE